MNTISYIKKHSLSLLFLLVIILIYYFHISHFQETIFTQQTLSSIYDASATSLLKGSMEIPEQDILWEAFYSNGRIVSYFGIFPAILRIPLNFLYPENRLLWGNILSLIAFSISLFFIFLNIERQLSLNLTISDTTRTFLLWSSLFGISFASPFFYLASNGSVYHEAILWGLAFSNVAIYFAFSIINQASYKTYLAFSVATGLCLITRITFAFPLVLISIFFILNEILGIRTYKGLNILSILIPILIGSLIAGWCNYDRFGNPLVFADYSTRYDTAPESIKLSRVPDTLNAYFLPNENNFYGQFPYVKLHGPTVDEQNGFYHVEPTISGLMTFGWLIVCSAWGLFLLYKTSLPFKIVVSSFLLESGIVLCFFSITNRYNAEFLPLLLSGFYIFLNKFKLKNINFNLCLFTSLSILLLVGSYINIFSTLVWISETSIFISEEDMLRIQDLLQDCRYLF